MLRWMQYQKRWVGLATFVFAWYLYAMGTGGHDYQVGGPYDSIQACNAAGNAMFHGAGAWTCK